MAKTIRLYSGRGVAIVDDSDFEILNQYRWHITTAGYAARYAKGNSKVLMHREVNDTPEGMHTDHINGVKLDNRRENLRTATARQNSLNRERGNRGSKSKFLGVTRSKKDRRWRAQLCVGRSCRHIGYFDREEDAAEAYRKAKKAYAVV